MSDGYDSHPPRFTVEAALTLPELERYQSWAAARHREVGWPPGWMPCLAVGAFLSLTGDGIATLSGTVPQARGGLLAGLLMAAYMIGLNAADLITRHYRRWLLKAASDVMQSRRYEFRDDGLTVRQGPGYGVWLWSMFIKAETWDGLLLLGTSSIRALPIPMRTFASSDEATAALAFARTVIVDPFAPTAHPGRHA